MSVPKGQAPASFRNDGEGVRICHREFIGNIGTTGSTFPTPFTLATHIINPGVSTTFPWLSQVAQYFEEYDMKGLVFEYRPSSGMVTGTNPALGVVIMATDYNIENPDFANKQAMDSYEFANSTVPFNQCFHMVECRPRSNITNKLYVRNENPVSERLLYDLGKFEIATEGMPAAYTTGELWVTYDVCLTKPRIAGYSNATLMSHYVANPAGSSTAANFGGTSGLVDGISLTPLPELSASGNSVLFPVQGSYILLAYQQSGIAAATAAPTFTLGANIVASPYVIFANNVLSAFSTWNTANGTLVSVKIIQVNFSGTGATNLVTIGGGTGAASGNSDLLVWRFYTGPLMETKQLSAVERAVQEMLAMTSCPVNSDSDSIVDLEPVSAPMFRLKTKH